MLALSFVLIIRGQGQAIASDIMLHLGQITCSTRMDNLSFFIVGEKNGAFLSAIVFDSFFLRMIRRRQSCSG
jgi:hypothetical protein